MVVKKDLNNPQWQSEAAYDQPKLAEYYYGLILYPRYLTEKKASKDLTYTQFLINNNFNIEKPGGLKFERKNDLIKWTSTDWGPPGYFINKYGEGFKKTINTIFFVRKGNVFLLSLNLMVVYFLALVLTNSLFLSLMTAIIYGPCRTIIADGLQSHSDGLFVLLFNLGLLFLLRVFFKEKPRLINFVLFGIFCSLVTQTKLNGIMLLGIFNALALITRQNFLKTILVNIIFFGLFVGFNPHLYKAPLKNTLFLYVHHYKIAQNQAATYNEVYLSTITSRNRAIINNVLENEFSKELFIVGTIYGIYLILKKKTTKYCFFYYGGGFLGGKQKN